jgi:hypothetical protein
MSDKSTKKTKAELLAMLAEAVRNTQPQPEPELVREAQPVPKSNARTQPAPKRKAKIKKIRR